MIQQDWVLRSVLATRVLGGQQVEAPLRGRALAAELVVR